MPFTVGKTVFVKREGIAVVRAVANDGRVSVGQGEEVWFEFEPAEAESALRPLVTGEHASHLLALLASGEIRPLDGDNSARAIAYRHAGQSGELDVLVQTLGAIYADRRQEYPEVQNRVRFERWVFEWLAATLGRPPDALRDETRSGLPPEPAPAWASAVAAQSRERLPPPPPVAGLHAMGTFLVDAAVAAGEVGALGFPAASVRIAVKHGRWGAYQRQYGADALELLVSHHEDVAVLEGAATVGPWISLGRVETTAGQLALVDENHVQHPDVLAAARAEAADEIVAQRGVVSNTGPDPGGVFPLLGYRVEGQVVALVARFGEVQPRRRRWWPFW